MYNVRLKLIVHFAIKMHFFTRTLSKATIHDHIMLIICVNFPYLSDLFFRHTLFKTDSHTLYGRLT